MSNMQYIGARYVPIVYTNPDDGSANWKAGVTYESLTVVVYNGDSYTSKKAVPDLVGNPADNLEYWVKTGDFNASLLALQNKVLKIENETFDTFNSMIESTTLEANTIVHTNGYETVGDGGEGYYSIETRSGNFSSVTAGGLYAIPILTTSINLNMLGCVNGAEISNILQSVIDYVSTRNEIIQITLKSESVTCNSRIDVSSLNESNRSNVLNINFGGTRIVGNGNDFILSTNTSTLKNVTVSNAYLEGFRHCFDIKNWHFGTQILDIYALNCDNIIKANECYYLGIKNVTARIIDYELPNDAICYEFAGQTNLILLDNLRTAEGYAIGYKFQSCEAVKMQSCGIENVGTGIFVNYGYNLLLDSCYFEGNDVCIECNTIMSLTLVNSWLYHPAIIIKNNTRISNLKIDESNYIVFDENGKFFDSVNSATFGKIAFGNLMSPNAKTDIRTLYATHNINDAVQLITPSITYNTNVGYGSLFGINEPSLVGTAKNIGRISPLQDNKLLSNVTVENNSDGTIIYHTSVVYTKRQLVYVNCEYVDTYRRYKKSAFVFGDRVSYLDAEEYGFITVVNNDGMTDIVVHGGTEGSPTSATLNDEFFYLNILA